MGKITVLVPREDMRGQAHNVMQEKQYDIGAVQVIRTEDAVTAARTAGARGAKVLVARGLQASLIKQYTDIPVAEIVVTAQEMGLLVVKAKEILKKETPVIAVVGFRNMFSDMSLFNTIYDIELRTYFAASNSLLAASAREAAEDGADLIIGGEVVTETAKKCGIPSLFLSTTEDALRRAFDTAQGMLFAREKAETVRVLPPSEEGLPSYYRNRRPVVRKTGVPRPPLVRFSDLTAESAAMRDCVARAQLYAKLENPLFICGEPGTETELLAACIHQAGSRSDAAFLAASCAPDGDQSARLFGADGLLRRASGGSVYLRDVSLLNRYQQDALYRAIRSGRLPQLSGSGQGDEPQYPVHVRVMAGAEEEPGRLAASGSLLPELAASFSGLVLTVPPLRERREDLLAIAAQSLRAADERLGTYHVLTDEAKRVLAGFPWRGNVPQLEGFCARLAVEAHRRTVSGAFVRRLYESLYPQEQAAAAHPGEGAVRSEEEERIRAAWVRYDGNRQKMAQALGISPATLWRRIQKYRLNEK